MGDLVIVGAIIAAGTAILARSPRLRLGASVLFVLLTVGALAQLSRASVRVDACRVSSCS